MSTYHIELFLFAFIGVILGLAAKRYFRSREWKPIYNAKGDAVVMWYINLVKLGGYVLRLNWMVGPDLPGCFHTHPGRCWRFILWGGYKEEVWQPSNATAGFIHFFGGWFERIRPLTLSRVEPDHCHRIHCLTNGRGSISLFLIGPRTHDVLLRGIGWPPDTIPIKGARLDLPTQEERDEVARMEENERRQVAMGFARIIDGPRSER